MKIEYKNHLNAAPKILARDIPIGTMFTGRIGNMDDHVVARRPSIDLYLRAYGVIVSMSKPVHTWISLDTEQWARIVYDYQVVDAKVVVE